MTILITGATGLVGRALTLALLEQGTDVRVVTRRPHRVLEAFSAYSSRVLAFEWHPRTEPFPPEALAGVERVIHLMGAPLQGIPKLDHAINAGLLLSYVCLRTGDRVGWFTFDAQVRSCTEPEGGTAAFRRLQQQTSAVEYSTGDGTALAPGDYRPKSDELTFLPGQVRKAVSIPVVPDDLAEGSLEEFTGYLLSTVGAPIDRDFGTFTIFDE